MLQGGDQARTWESGNSGLQQHASREALLKVLLLLSSVAACLPKGPSRTKNSTESKVRGVNPLWWEQNGTESARKCLFFFFFWEKRGRKTVQRVKNYGGSKILRIRRHSGAVLFLARKGPLGCAECTKCPDFSAMRLRSFSPCRKTLRDQRLKKIKIASRDWNFQARLKIPSGPPTKPVFLWGILKVRIEMFKREWIFQAGLQISSKIESFQSLGPSGKEFGKRSLAKKWRKMWQKHQKKWPKGDRKSPENEKKWSNSFCRPLFAAPRKLSDAGEKIAPTFWAPKASFPPQSLAIFPCDRKMLAMAMRFDWFFGANHVPTAQWPSRGESLPRGRNNPTIALRQQ